MFFLIIDIYCSNLQKEGQVNRGKLRPGPVVDGQETFILDIIGDGHCFWYTLLSYLLGFVVGPQHYNIVHIFKDTFTKLVPF